MEFKADLKMGKVLEPWKTAFFTNCACNHLLSMLEIFPPPHTHTKKIAIPPFKN